MMAHGLDAPLLLLHHTMWHAAQHIHEALELPARDLDDKVVIGDAARKRKGRVVWRAAILPPTAAAILGACHSC
eukprot:1498715-Prymnesium_polylepis.1